MVSQLKDRKETKHRFKKKKEGKVTQRRCKLWPKGTRCKEAQVRHDPCGNTQI